MAFMKDGGFPTQVEDGMRFIMASIKNGGSFGGSTQATILCLKALILYYDTHLELKQPADFALKINDKEVKTLRFKNSTSKLDFPVFSEDNLTSLASDNLIELSMSTIADSQGQDFALSYLIEVEYLESRPPSASEAKIEFHLRYLVPIESLEVGQGTTQELELINVSQEPQGMSVAIIRVPSCLKLDVNQFELLKNKGVFNHYEVAPDLSSYTVYWTSMKPFKGQESERKSASITLVRDFAGERCQERASVAYLYYDNENKLYV